MDTPLAVLIALPVLVLEVLQLLMAERKFGVKVIRNKENPRDLLESWSPIIGFFWVTIFGIIWVYSLALIFTPYRIYAYCIIGTTILGSLLRRLVSIKWILFALTIEGAVRIGLYANLFVVNIFYK